MSARVPTSRAYWNLRAEQVMDNVFDRETVTVPSQPHLLPLISGIAVAGVICSSGWVLSEVTDSGAVISRNGQRQTLSVGGLF